MEDKYIGKFLDNRYEILERIGSGGMAVVYRAKCHLLNRFVAVKILKDELAEDEEFRRRFHEESQAVAMLSHPNIVAVYDVSHTSDVDYIVMELIDGITLKQYIQKKGGKLSWKEALHFITQIMKALSHAHGRGIIHRDIKPHNIMVLRDGTVKVADFGIARLTNGKQNTMTQEALGSVHYISPEQARGSRIDARSDIYSAGVVLYEMLTGRLPYEGDSPVAVAIQHINSIPLSPREIDDSIPEPMEAITVKAMASDVDKRYVSADAMLADLDAFRKNPNINFDYTAEDLKAGDGDEPTMVLGANSPQTVTPRPAHSRYADEDDYYEDKGHGLRTGLIIGGAVLCVVLLLVFLWYSVFSGNGKTYPVPDMRSMTVEEARALPAVTENGFTIVEGGTVQSDTVEEGKIVSQDPEPNSTVQEDGRTVTVTVAGKSGGVSVPDVYNLTEAEATDKLTGEGFQVKTAEGASEDVTKGNVLSQVPAAETEAKKGDTVTITVSTGPDGKSVTMVTFVGQKLEDAQKSIEGTLNLKVVVKEVSSEEYGAGIVVWQSVNGGESVKEGTAITLRVSTGPAAPDAADPTPSASAVPTPEAPTPTPAGPPQVSKEIVVDLPVDREAVMVKISVGGVPQVSQMRETKLRTALFTVTGTSGQEIVVYVDGQQVKTDVIP